MIHVACAADERYAAFCMAMLHSLLVCETRGGVTIHFLHAPELPAAVRTALKRLAESFGAALVLDEIADARIASLPTLPRIGRETWFRALLPRLKPQLQRILYLDADTFVVEDLRPLWATDLGAHYVAAVSNVMEPRFANRAVDVGLPQGTLYFNAGVLLMNLDAMRADHCTERILSYAHTNADRLFLSDQDALNAVLGARRLPLHPRWNCQNSLFLWPSSRGVFGDATVEEAIRAPAILHFEGPHGNKPWHYRCAHPFRELYRRHLRAIPYPAPPMTGRTLKNLLINHMPERALPPLRRLIRSLRRVGLSVTPGDPPIDS